MGPNLVAVPLHLVEDDLSLRMAPLFGTDATLLKNIYQNRQERAGQVGRPSFPDGNLFSSFLIS